MTDDQFAQLNAVLIEGVIELRKLSRRNNMLVVHPLTGAPKELLLARSSIASASPDIYQFVDEWTDESNESLRRPKHYGKLPCTVIEMHSQGSPAETVFWKVAEDYETVKRWLLDDTG